MGTGILLKKTVIAAHPHKRRLKIDLCMGSRQEEHFCNHEGVRMYDRQSLCEAYYQSVLLHTPSAENLLPLALFIFRDFRDITREFPPQPTRPQALLFAMSTPEGRRRS